jgi:hypothetical protein
MTYPYFQIFNVVAITDSAEQSVTIRIRRLVQKLAVALAYEQKRCAFVSSQVHIIIQHFLELFTVLV